ncbi:centromere protein T isoform X3 [Amblyraja radiata]|uniref:centromere protein T isoform X3 n=1 Tax=Amblyraja radiata TaxID=386614 RepID=UPI00140283B0|nr:centromere protein T isoform X3 [Amblyraja radiata]
MDSLHEDVTMRTLFKGMIAEDVPQSAVRPGKWRLQTTKGTPKKSTDVQTQESPRMLLRSQMKAKIRRTRNQITATAGSSAKYSTRNKSSALTKSKRFEAMHQENVDNDTPRQLLKKFMQTELESSLVKVPTPKTKTSVKNMSQSKTKSLSDSDRLSLNLPEKDTEEHTLPGDLKFRNRKKVSVSEFENALQQRLNYTTEPQEGEKSIRPPDISTIVGYSLINPDFEESTTKPILCRRPLKRKVISEDDFEEGVHNYLEQDEEPDETEKSEAFEKTGGLTDISRLVSSINFGFDETVSVPVLIRRPRRTKLINEDDFEGGVLFHLQQAEEKSSPEIQEMASDNKEKEKSITNAEINEVGITELCPTPQQTQSDEAEAVSNEEVRNEFGPNTGLDQKKQTQFASDEEGSIKTLNAGRDGTQHLMEAKILADTDPQMEYGAADFTTDPRGDDMPVVAEIVIISHIQENDGYREDLEMPEQNLPIRDRQESPSMQHPEGMLVDETVEGHDVNDGRDEDGETVDILEDTGRMEYAEEDGENADGPKMDNGRVGTEGGESRKDVEAVTERMQGAKIKELGSLELDSDSADAAELDSSSADVLVLDNNRVDGPGLDSSSGNAAGLDGSRKGASGLDGSRKGASGLDGSRKGAPGLDGSRKVASGLDGSRKVASRLDGSMAGASRLDGNMAGASGLDESRKGASGLDGSRKVASGLDGSMLGASGLDGSMPGASGLDGSMAGASGLDGSMAGASGLDGSMAGVSGLDGSRKGVSRLDGSRKGVSRLDGSMAGASGLDGSMAGASRLDGSMAGASGLDGSMSGASRLDGSMAGASGLDGSMAGASGLDGSRKGASRLDSSRKGTSRLDGSMAGASGLGGSMSGASGLGSNMAGTSGLASGSRAGASRLDDDKLAGGETDNARMEDTESDGDTESDEMDVEELMHNIEYEKDDSKVSSSEKLLKSSPLLTTPHFLKILGRRAQKPLAKVNNPRKPKQIRKKTVLPSSFVKSVFNHYAKMRVKKESFGAINQCLELYFKQLCDDMDVYSKHAKRRTIEKEDLELLMKRQGFVTAKMPLNVLIENHLSMECREKLIPMAVSGNKMIPKK